MNTEASPEIFTIADGASLERPAHHQGIEQKIAHENPYGKDEHGRIGSHLARCRVHEIFQVHGGRHKTVEERHQQTGHQRKDQPFGRYFLRLFRLLAIRDGIKNNGHSYQGYAGEKHDRIALRRAHIIHDHPQHQGQPYPHREGHRQPGDGNRRRQQDIGRVKHHSADKRAPDILPLGLLQVREEAATGLSQASQRKGRNK
ncbi:hypothetical protein FQZ97_894690 [compost metagenome]